MFRCLIGTTPPASFYESLKSLKNQKPSDNIYDPPVYLQKYILSNDMCYILSRLLHPNPNHRYSDLTELRRILYDLKQNILSIPQVIREVLGHPNIPQSEAIDSNLEEISPK